MKKNVLLFSVLAVILTVILGFNFTYKGKTDDPTSRAAYVYTNTDNLIVGAKYNPDNINSIWSESFDGVTYPPTGWVQIQESGTATWARVTAGSFPVCAPHSGAGMIGFNSFSVSTGTSSLVSAVFSLTSGQAKLGFWMYRDSGYPSTADLVNYLINTAPNSSGATLLGTINRSKTLAPVETGADGWYYYEFTIPSSFNTTTNYIILQATSAYGNDIYVDDIAVNLILAHDVGMVSVDVASPILPGATIPKATVKNFGTSSETFPVLMTINPGGYSNTQNVTSLAAGASLQVSFANWVATTGTYTVKVITQSGTDLNRTNDTLLKTVIVTTAGWLSGAVCPSPQSLGAGVGYTRNDTGWVFSIGGQAGLTPVTKYNVNTNTWTTVAPLPAGRDRFSACLLKDSIYVVGGADAASVYYATVYKYDIKADAWVTRASLPGILGWNKVVGYQDSLIYCAGGYNGTALQSQVLLYNANTNTWRTATSLPIPLFGGGFARIGDTLVYAGGTDNATVVSTTYVGIISQTDRSVITWTSKAPMPAGAFRVDADQWGCKGIIMAGGSSSFSWTADFLAHAYVYSPFQNAWTTLADMPTALTAPHSASVRVGPNKWRYVVACGYNGTTYGTPQIYADSLNCLISGVIGNGNIIPIEYALNQNYPNPFNPVTKISYATPKAGIVTMKVYDVIGRQVATLVNEFKNAGFYSVDFNGVNLSSGVYFYNIEVNGFKDIKKMILIK
jgi:N-acetylneuraminic acid mutarotase